MQIICPECGFTREVDESKIPARSKVATCPKCKLKFQFRDFDDEPEFEMEAPDDYQRNSVAAEHQPEHEDNVREAMHEQETEAPREPVSQQEAPPKKEGVTRYTYIDEDEFPEEAAQMKHKKEQEEIWERLHGMSPPNADDSAFPEDEFPSHAPWGKQKPLVPPPFEDLDKYGFFPGLYQTIGRVLRQPKLFFEVMPIGSGFARPMVYALLILLFHDLMSGIWQVAGLSPASTFPGNSADPSQLTAGATATGLLGTLVLSPLMWAVLLVIISGVHHLVLKLLSAAEGGFEATFRGVAYSCTPMVLATIPLFNQTISTFVLGFFSVWVTVLTIVAWKLLHRTSFLKAGLAMMLPTLLAFVIGMLFAASGAIPTV